MPCEPYWIISYNGCYLNINWRRSTSFVANFQHQIPRKSVELFSSLYRQRDGQTVSAKMRKELKALVRLPQHGELVINSHRFCHKFCIFNPLTPNDPYKCRTAPLTSKRCILYIIQQIQILRIFLTWHILFVSFSSKSSLFHNFIFLSFQIIFTIFLKHAVKCQHPAG